MSEERWVDEFDSLTMTTRCDKPINECAEWHGLCPVGLKDFIRSLVEKTRREAYKEGMAFGKPWHQKGRNEGLERAIEIVRASVNEIETVQNLKNELTK